jgi:EF hand
MKNKIAIALAVLALGASAFVASAQDTNPPPNDGVQGWQGGPGGMHGHRPPPSPLMQALDVNHDGVIDADEIANAPAELKTLDKNGDGKLTQDELRPPRPPMNGDPGNDRPPGPPPGDQGDNTAPSGPPPQQ